MIEDLLIAGAQNGQKLDLGVSPLGPKQTPWGKLVQTFCEVERNCRP